MLGDSQPNSMAKSAAPFHYRLSLLLLLLLLALLSSSALAKSSPRPITDIEIRQKKNACYADIESGLWGTKCRSSITEKENCALRCLSPSCYSLIYESDPLEEGEKDYIRGQEYKYCMHKMVWVYLYLFCWYIGLLRELGGKLP